MTNNKHGPPGWLYPPNKGAPRGHQMNVMTGYFKNEVATKEAFTEDGWLRTGDLGIIDKNNFIFIKIIIFLDSILTINPKKNYE